MGKYTKAQIELMDETISKLLNLNDSTDIFDHYKSDLRRIINRISFAIDSDDERIASENLEWIIMNRISFAIDSDGEEN